MKKRFMSGINGGSGVNLDGCESVSSEEELSLSLKKKLETFYNDPVISHKVSLNSFWSAKKNFYPEVYELYVILAGVPCTQVEVERLFSALKWILSDRRNRMAAELISNILLIRCNWELVKQIPIFSS